MQRAVLQLTLDTLLASKPHEFVSEGSIIVADDDIDDDFVSLWADDISGS